MIAEILIHPRLALEWRRDAIATILELGSSQTAEYLFFK